MIFFAAHYSCLSCRCKTALLATLFASWPPTVLAQAFDAASPSNGSTEMLPSTTSVAGGPVAEHGRLTVVGNHLVGEHGKPVRLRGLSLFWSQWGEKYWNADVVEWLQADWGIDVVRAAVGVEHGGYLENPAGEREKLHAVVQAAVDSGIYVIIDWHDHAANLHLEQAKEFFEEMASTYGSLPNVLFETFNEPTSQSWVQVIKPYHEEILQIIRRYSRNVVICGTPTWSQDVDVASFNEISGENIAYTLHFYAGTHTKYLRDKAVTALCNCVALFVSEWGACEAFQSTW
eukprot:TRINITY_DN12718_c0_g1_i2.p1 TRINITY_DN12718_c0_g1~~TRINITY_DN12718_c0_g1_i2.p1  ORF type:complete len:322 (+),score=62.04 TRINITY_DN12718_c0_g1_i2:102-968(+)